MPKTCDVCGKGVDFGHRVTFAGNRNKRIRRPNLQRVRAVYNGRRGRYWVCTRCLKAGKVQKVA